MKSLTRKDLIFKSPPTGDALRSPTDVDRGQASGPETINILDHRPKSDIYLVYLKSRVGWLCTNFVLCVLCGQAMNRPSLQISLPFQEFHCHIDFHPPPLMIATGLGGRGSAYGHR